MKDHEHRPDPRELLAAFITANRCESAFTRLVESLSGLVYTSALRGTGDPQLAEEVTQNVFAIMARKAESLRRHPSLLGWALETSRLQSASVVRSETRRHRKLAALAREANDQDTVNAHCFDEDASWKDALPILHDELARLPLKDRDVILQRFYEGKKFSEIARVSGQSQGACKMRLQRALAKLSKLLTARGTTLSITALASGLGAEFAQAAPAQLSAMVAPKALAASSSLSTYTIITNSLMTMSTTKTVTLTTAAVLATASIPFVQQHAEASKLETELRAVMAQQSAGLLDSNTMIVPQNRGDSQRILRPEIRTPTALLASLEEPIDNRALINDLLEHFSGDSMERMRVRMRIAQMSRKEYTKLLDDLDKFPCSAVTKNTLIASISGLAPEIPMREKLDRMVASGRDNYRMSLVGKWAASDPDEALRWYEEKVASGELFKGVADGYGDTLQRTTLEYLISGLGKSKPDLAIDLFRASPKDDTGENALRWLAGSLAEGLIQSGDDTHVLTFLDMHTGEDRKEVLAQAFVKYGSAGKYDEGLAFVDTHNPEPGDRVDYIGKMVSWVPDWDQIPAAMDWALSVIPEGEAAEAARRMAYIAADERATAKNAVLKWLDDQPIGPVRDQGFAGIANYSVEHYDYERALNASAKIGSASVRDETRQTIRSNWEAWVQKRGWEKATKNIRDDVVEQLENL